MEVTLEDRGRQIQALLDGGAEPPTRERMMNNGRRRTESKQQLLAGWERLRRESGHSIGFDAKF